MIDSLIPHQMEWDTKFPIFLCKRKERNFVREGLGQHRQEK